MNKDAGPLRSAMGSAVVFLFAGLTFGFAGSPPSAAADGSSPAGITLDICPNWYGGFGENSPPLTCGCARGAGKGATIWGANPYTWRSNICSAALHAGVIGPDGGQVVVTPEKVRVAPSVTRNSLKRFLLTLVRWP